MSALLDLLKQKKQDLAAGKRRKTIKPTDGRGRYRILPSWRGDGQQFWHDFGQHFVKNAAKEITAIYMCTDKTFGRPCSVCEAIGQGIKSATDDYTMEILKDARSTGRVLLNVLHLDGPTPGEVQILELPPTVFGQVIEIAQEWEEAGESIFALNGGKDIIVSREGSGKNTKYTSQVAAKSLPVDPSVLAKLHNLDEYVRQESSEQMARALNSVRSVSGLLPAPSASSGLPAAASAAGAATLVDDDPYAAAPPPVRRAAPAESVEDVTPRPVVRPAAAPAPAPAPAVAAAPAAVADSSLGDPELDALLNELGG